MDDQPDASSYMRRRAAADPMLAIRWAHRFVPPPATYASATEEESAAQPAQAQAASASSALLREDYEDPFDTHQPMSLAHGQHHAQTEMRHEPDDDEDPFASLDDGEAESVDAPQLTADAVVAAESSSERASKRARVSEANGIAAAAAASSSGATSSSVSLPPHPQQAPQPQPQQPNRSTKRFSKAHQSKEGRTIAATAQVSSEIPREPEEQTEAASSSAAAAIIAAASSPTAAIAAAPAVPVTPDPRRRKRSQAASAGDTHPAGATTPPSAGSTPPASAAAAAAGTPSPRMSLDALKSFFSRHPTGLSPASAAAAAAPAKPAAINGAPDSSAGWASAQPTLADFPATAAAGASPVSTCGAPWIADYSCSSSTARYPPAVIEERIAFLAMQVARAPAASAAAARHPHLPNLTLTPTFLVMGCAVIMRQSRLSREHASSLLPILETVVREHMVPPALLSNFRSLLEQFQTRLEHKSLPLLVALQADLSRDHTPARTQSPNQFRSNEQLTCRHWLKGTCTYGDNCTFRHGTVETPSQPNPAATIAPPPAAAAAPSHASAPPLPRTPPRSSLPSTPPLAGLLGHMPGSAGGHIPFVVTPALAHAIPVVIERPAFVFHSDSPPPPPTHLPLPPMPPTQQNAHQQHAHQPSYAAVAAAASSSHPAHVQFTSQHQAQGQRSTWLTTDYSQQQQQPQHAHAPTSQSAVGATVPLPSRSRWDAPPPVRAPLSASFVPASGAAAPKMQLAYAPAMKQLPLSPFNFHMPAPAAAAAGSGSGSSASTAICLEDSDPVLTVASVVASQTLSLADSHAFVHASFASDDLIHRQKLPLVDPLTLARISIPVRSRYCHHVRCLDLETILMQAAETASRGKPLRCPICNECIALQDLVVDSFIKMRLEEASRLPDASELILHRDGSYTFTGDNGRELKPMARTQSAPSLSGAEAADTGAAAAAASSSSSAAKPSSKRDTVDLLDSDAEQSESDAAPLPRPLPPPSRARSVVPAAVAPRPQYADKRPRSSFPAAAAAASDADDESRSEDVSRSSTPIHRGRAFSDPPTSEDASSSAASSPALAPRRPPPVAAAAAGGAPVPYPSSYAIPRSAWNGPSMLLGQGTAAAPRASGSQLRPASAASAPAVPRVFHADIDLTLSSDESDESSVQAIEHPQQHAQAQAHDEQPDEGDDDAAAAVAAESVSVDVVPAAASASSASPGQQTRSGEEAAAAAAAGSVNLDALSPALLLSPPVATVKHARPPQSLQYSPAQILQIEDSVDHDQRAYPSVPVHPPSLSSLGLPQPQSSPPAQPSPPLSSVGSHAAAAHAQR